MSVHKFKWYTTKLFSEFLVEQEGRKQRRRRRNRAGQMGRRGGGGRNGKIRKKRTWEFIHWKVAGTIKQRPTFEKMNMNQNIFFIQWASAFPVIRKEFLTCGSVWRQSCTFPEFAFSSPVLWMFSVGLLLAKLPDLGARRGLGGGWGSFACLKSQQGWAW